MADTLSHSMGFPMLPIIPDIRGSRTLLGNGTQKLRLGMCQRWVILRYFVARTTNGVFACKGLESCEAKKILILTQQLLLAQHFPMFMFVFRMIISGGMIRVPKHSWPRRLVEPFTQSFPPHSKPNLCKVVGPRNGGMGVTDPGVTECGETWPADEGSPTWHRQPSMKI